MYILASDIEQATVTMATNFTGTVNISRALIPLLRPHARVVNVASFTGLLHRFDPNIQVSNDMFNLNMYTEQAKFTDPNLTEAKLIALVDEYIELVREGKFVFIIIVSSGYIVCDVGKDKQLGWNNTKYGTSKTAVIALTKVHAKELAECGKEDILVNSCCPGWVRTDMAGDRAPLSPDEGAETPVIVALLPAGSPSGEFWKDKKVTQW